MKSTRTPVKCPVGELPNDLLCFLLNSRYWAKSIAFPISPSSYSATPLPDGHAFQAICDWVHGKVTFSYPHARPTKSAVDV